MTMLQEERKNFQNMFQENIIHQNSSMHAKVSYVNSELFIFNTKLVFTSLFKQENQKKKQASDFRHCVHFNKAYF